MMALNKIGEAAAHRITGRVLDRRGLSLPSFCLNTLLSYLPFECNDWGKHRYFEAYAHALIIIK